MHCLPPDFVLTGSFSSENFNSIVVELKYEFNNQCSLSYEQFIERVFEVRMQFIFANEYFDPLKNEDPIKTVISDQYYVYMSPKLYTNYDIFIEKNTYEIEKGYLFSNKKIGEFFRAGKEK